MGRSAKVKAALNHPDKLRAGAKARKAAHLSKDEEFEAVMAEMNRGTLNSGSGKRVTNPKQAKAIAESENSRNRR